MNTKQIRELVSWLDERFTPEQIKRGLEMLQLLSIEEMASQNKGRWSWSPESFNRLMAQPDIHVLLNRPDDLSEKNDSARMVIERDIRTNFEFHLYD